MALSVRQMSGDRSVPQMGRQLLKALSFQVLMSFMLFILDSLPINYFQVFNVLLNVFFISLSVKLTILYFSTQPSAYRTYVVRTWRVLSNSSFTFKLWEHNEPPVKQDNSLLSVKCISGLCNTLACHNRHVGYFCLLPALRITMCRLQMLQFVTHVTSLNQSIRCFVPQLPLCVFRTYLFIRRFILPRRTWQAFWGCWRGLWFTFVALITTFKHHARSCLDMVSDRIWWSNMEVTGLCM